MSGIPHHIDLYPGRNVYLTSWFVLSVLFLTVGEMSVVPTCIRDPPSHGSPPQKEHLPDQLVHFSLLFLTGGEMSVVPTCVHDLQSHRPPPQ